MVKSVIMLMILGLLGGCSRKNVTITYLDCGIDFYVSPSEEDLKYNYKEIIRNEVHPNKIIRFIRKSNSKEINNAKGIDNRFMFTVQNSKNNIKEYIFMDCFGTISKMGVMYKADSSLLEYLCNNKTYESCPFCK